MKKSNSFLSPGFTIVELLVVIVVIGILAAIIIVSYIGISQQAREASLKSDLDNGSKLIKLFQVAEASGNYPTANVCPSPGATEICLKPSGSNTYTYPAPNNSSNPKTFTLDATNGTTTYRITNDSTPVAVTTIEVAIGDTYQGGIVAYILQPEDPGYIEGQTRGLIAAPSDQSTDTVWGCYQTVISGADGTAIGTGNQNTIDIMAGCSTAGIAARLAGDLVLNGYSDWYLPSKDELNQLYLNRVAIGGFTDWAYWSSSEYNADEAWNFLFLDGYPYTWGKEGGPFPVRAVRAF